MSIFGILLLCTQAFLIQNAYSQCIGPGIDGFGPYGPGPALAGPLGGPLGPVGAYGGAGVGDVAVAGELPVAGTTLVAGQVPILGAVEFGGIVPAAGTVTISGACGCSCAGPFVF